MKTKEIMQAESIPEYIDLISRIKRDYSKRNLLFRGQVNLNWKLESSLERIGICEIEFERYYSIINDLIPSIESVMGKKFDAINIRELSTDVDKLFNDVNRYFEDCKYLTYLRHHGFPTPILDWTRSEYIALFFACEDYKTSNCSGKIFVYHENGRFIPGDKTFTYPILNSSFSDKRHFIQQSTYVAALKNNNGKIYVSKFDDANETVRNDNGVITNKIEEVVIPCECKRSIICELNKMNINRYSIYLDEDSFIRTLGEHVDFK